MNKADPRFDSDMDHRNNPASNVGTTGAGYGTSTGVGHGAGYGTSSAGVGHGTGMGHSTGYTDTTSSVTPGSGNTARTAGPHNSDMMNKLDPR
jgi:hypothetical protein